MCSATARLLTSHTSGIQIDQILNVQNVPNMIRMLQACSVTHQVTHHLPYVQTQDGLLAASAVDRVYWVVCVHLELHHSLLADSTYQLQTMFTCA